MKRAKVLILIVSLIVFILFLPLAIYIMLPNETKSLISALVDVPLAFVEVPACNSRIADKLGIQPDTVRDYVIESLKLGMTSNEVEGTLSQIAPISILETYVVDTNQNTYVSVRVDLCNNPLGDMVLDVYYSKDGDLIRAEDAWAD